MSDEIVKQGESRTNAGTLAAGVTGAVALTLCCGGGLIAAALGLGALAAFLVNPWFLFPVVLITAGAVYLSASFGPHTAAASPTGWHHDRYPRESNGPSVHAIGSEHVIVGDDHKARSVSS